MRDSSRLERLRRLVVLLLVVMVVKDLTSLSCPPGGAECPFRYAIRNRGFVKVDR